jgi:hypothetical protein
VRIFVTKEFDRRFVRREKIADEKLCDAVERAEKGLIDADLGGNLIKQRVARAGQGLSRGYRTLVARRAKERAVFLHGFAKNELDNIKPDDLERLKKLTATFLSRTDQQIAAAVAAQEWREVKCGEEEQVPEQAGRRRS